MIQVIGFLLCVYLVFKGIEIFQIALSSPRDYKTWPMIVGVVSLLASIALAAFFAWWLAEQGQQMQNIQNQMPRLP